MPKREVPVAGARKRKVMHVLTDTNIGGAGTLLYNTIACGDREKFSWVVVLPRGSRLTERLHNLPCRVIEISGGRDRSSDVGSFFEYCRVIRQEEPDILHTHAALTARLAGRACGVPVCVQTRHCVFPLKPYQKNPVFRAAFRTGTHLLSDGVVAVAEAARENLAALGLPREDVRVIVNGVLPVRECPEEELTAVRERRGIEPGDFVVGMSARLEEYKGQLTVLEAAAQCLRQAENFRFIFLGDGSCRERYERRARELQIENRVIFTGFVADPAPYYTLMDVNVNASSGTETSSLALSEGMSVGVPCVASAYGGNPKMVRDGVNGLLFPTGDADALAEALLRLHGDEAFRRKLSEGARAWYQERLTAPAMVRQLEAFYLDQLEAKAHPRGGGRVLPHEN